MNNDYEHHYYYYYYHFIHFVLVLQTTVLQILYKKVEHNFVPIVFIPQPNILRSFY